MKIRNRELSLAHILLATVTGLAVAGELPDREEYAYGFPLEMQEGSEFLSATITLEVYRAVADPALRDAGVYNAAGQPVPRIFEHPTPKDTSTEQKTVLGLLPLYGQQADQPDQLRLLLHQNANGTTLDLDVRAGAIRDRGDADGEGPLTAYIIDVREFEFALKALDFVWQPLPQGFIGTVMVEDSDDLRHWRNLGTSTLAELQFEQTRIEQRRVSLGRKISDYLRITWQDMPVTWKLNAVTGIYTEQGTAASRDWLILDSFEPGETERELVFDVGGYPPVDRVNVLLPDDNVVVRASVFYRRGGQDSWRLAHNGIFYNISRQGRALQSPAAAVRDVRAGQWKIRIDSGMTTGPVRLQLGWRPDRLIFLAQGSAPFELVTGRAQDALDQFPQETVLGDNAIFRMLRESGQAGAAIVGTREVISGPDRLEISASKPWRVWLLWAGLTGAIVLVAWLVYSLMREMRRS